MGRQKPGLSNDLIGAAGVHYVVYRLSLRGLVALPTIRNTAGIDLLVSDPQTGAQASLQVKASSKRVTFWPTSRPTKIARGRDRYFVFLRYDRTRETFEGFIETADRVWAQVRANAADYTRRGRREFPHWRLPEGEAEQGLLRESWETWRPHLARRRP